MVVLQLNDRDSDKIQEIMIQNKYFDYVGILFTIQVITPDTDSNHYLDCDSFNKQERQNLAKPWKQSCNIGVRRFGLLFEQTSKRLHF